MDRENSLDFHRSLQELHVFIWNYTCLLWCTAPVWAVQRWVDERADMSHSTFVGKFAGLNLPCESWWWASDLRAGRLEYRRCVGLWLPISVQSYILASVRSCFLTSLLVFLCLKNKSEKCLVTMEYYSLCPIKIVSLFPFGHYGIHQPTKIIIFIVHKIFL